ncbi:MAG: hypothetical protein QOI11_2176 [Candidatus Eremiobacteraeota bacterium]|nr:hypothetical protein [Candidatus Eremiobacteraeota bacterium]
MPPLAASGARPPTSLAWRTNRCRSGPRSTGRARSTWRCAGATANGSGSTESKSKIAPIIAGTIAALGLFVDKAASTADYFVGSLLLIPLALLLNAFKTYDYVDYVDTPNLDELVRTYERWPLTYVRSVVIGTADAVTQNGSVIDRKARDLNRTMAVLFTVVIVVIAARTFEAVSAEQRAASKAGPHAGTARASPKPHG